MNAPAKITEGLSLRAIAREELHKTKGDVQKAIGRTVRRLLADEQLLHAVVEEAVMCSAEVAVRAKVRSDRGTIMATAARANAAVAEGLSRGIRNAILDFQLYDGTRLRFATAEQIARQIEIYEQKSSDMAAKARWLRLIAQGVPRDKRVGDVIDDDRALELWKEAQA